MKTIILCISLLLITSYVTATEVDLGYSLFTKHAKNSDELNEQNEAIYISIDDFFYTTFNNSNNIKSMFFGCKFSKNIMTNLKINLYVGPLYGYGKYTPDIYGWTLGLAPTFELEYNILIFELLLVPCDGGVASGLVKIKFNL